MSHDPSIPPPPGNTPPGDTPPGSTPPPGPPLPPPGQATPPPPGGHPPAGFPPPGGPTPPGGGGGKKTGLIIGAVVLALLLIGGAVTTVLLLTGGDDDPEPTATPTSSTDPDDEPTDDPDDEEVDLDDGPWVDTVEDFTVAYYDGDCTTLMELAPGNWADEETCLSEIMPGQFVLDDYDIETIELDDEQDPTEATVEIDYTIIQVSTDQAQTFVTTFTVEDDGRDWLVSNFQTGG